MYFWGKSKILILHSLKYEKPYFQSVFNNLSNKINGHFRSPQFKYSLCLRNENKCYLESKLWSLFFNCKAAKLLIPKYFSYSADN